MKTMPDRRRRFKQNYSRRFLMDAVLLVVASLLMVFGTTGQVKAATGKENIVRWIGIDQLDSVIEEKKPVIVDLRTPLEYARGHLRGAVNVPVDDLNNHRSLLDTYKDQPVLLYCRTVNRTGRALEILEGRGFKSIDALKGGYEAWRLRGL